MSNGYFSIPRSLTRDPIWMDLTLIQQKVFEVILDRACFRTQKIDDHGVIIELKPGQLCTTIRQLVEWCNNKEISKNDIERSIKKLILCQFLRQEVRHTKSILTITHKDTYELILRASETGNETKVRQDRDKIETEKNNENNEKKEKKEKIKKEKILPISLAQQNEQAVGQDFSPSEKSKHNVYYQDVADNPNPISVKSKKSPKEEKINFREWVKLTQKEYDTLIQKHGVDFANAMLDALDSHNTSRLEHYKSDYGALKVGGWVYEKISKLRENSKGSFSQSDADFAKQVHAKFSDKLRGYLIHLGHNYIEFSPMGGNAQPLNLKFGENGFRIQVESFLRKCGVL